MSGSSLQTKLVSLHIVLCKLICIKWGLVAYCENVFNYYVTCVELAFQIDHYTLSDVALIVI